MDDSEWKVSDSQTLQSEYVDGSPADVHYLVTEAKEEAGVDKVSRRVFVSMIADANLSASQNELKSAIVEKISALGFQPEIFYNPRSVDGLAARRLWSPAEADDVIRQCIAGLIIGMPRWNLSDGSRNYHFGADYSQYEGAVLKTVDVPIQILAQENLHPRVVFDYTFGHICRFPEAASPAWLETADFKHALSIWLADIKDRRDLFLGYCSSSASTASQIRAYVEKELGASVLDWKRDFSVARSVLEEIIEAGKRCSGAIFLFTKDDVLTDELGTEPKRWRFKTSGPRADFAIPRDNVVFEAGYFVGIKGKRKVLVVREQGAKMPADLGGDVYAALEDRHNIESIKEMLRRFVLGL